MRTYNGTYGTIYYPDAICMAFNPMLIKATGGSYTRMVVHVGTSTPLSGLSETRYPNTDKDCWADISSYAQGFFDKSAWGNESASNPAQTTLGMTVYYSVTLYSGSNTESHTFNSFVVWGSMVSGETYNGYRERTWFTNFPCIGWRLERSLDIIRGIKVHYHSRQLGNALTDHV